MREHHVLLAVRKAYQSIELTKVSVILGFGDDASKASEFLRNRGFRLEGSYAFTQIDNSSDAGNKRFKLDQ
jgi:hypothetical protein